MARRKQALERNRQKKLERRKQRERKPNQLAPIATMSRKMAERLDDAYDLLDQRRYAYAEELLRKLDDRRTSYPQVVEALMFLYQSTKDHQGCREAAKRLMVLQPRDPEAQLMYAQESMFCAYATIARLNYERFIERWPEHKHVSKAKYALEILVPETETRLKNSGFPPDGGLELFALHEESLGLLQSGDYLGCAAKCRELLAKVPTFASARNNLAIAYFQSGRAADAVAVVEETRRLIPDNRFAEATLAKLYFFTGRAVDAQPLADDLVANPPTQQDAIVTVLETLALLGRDEDVVSLAEGTTKDQIVDDDSRAIRHHYLAYAKCRLGDEKTAKANWKKCVNGPVPSVSGFLKT
ncbi:MAG: tetratricopeptide repeat protein [Planctomycetia bacterium]|nr:tetratricopeptide repeat protein [Planctomycetia bacterium]